MTAGRKVPREQAERLAEVARKNPELGIKVLAARFGISACAVRKRLKAAGAYIRKDSHGNVLEAAP